MEGGRVTLAEVALGINSTQWAVIFLHIPGGPQIRKNLMIGVGMSFVLVVQCCELVALDVKHLGVVFTVPGRGAVLVGNGIDPQL